MSSGENGRAKRVVLLALVCAGCTAAPVIVLREAPGVGIPLEARPPVATVQPAAPPALSVEPPEPELPVARLAEVAVAPPLAPNLNDQLRGLSFG